MPVTFTWEKIVGLAAVVGHTSPQALARYAGISVAEVAEAIERATKEGLVVDGAVNEPQTLSMLADMGGALTAELHLTVARWFLVHGWADVTDLNSVTRHIRAAAVLVPIPDVIDRVDHVAKVALSTSDYETARVLLELADELGSTGDVNKRAWRLCRLSEALHGLGQVSAARHAASRAFELAEVSENVDLCLEACALSVFPTDWHAGDLRSAAMVNRLQQLELSPNKLALLHALSAIAEMRIPVFEENGQQGAWVTRATVAQPLAEKALDVVASSNSSDRLLALLAWRTCHRAPKFLERRFSISQEALNLSQRLHQPTRQVEAACFVAVDAIESGSWGKFEEALSVAKWVAGRDGNPRLLAHTTAIESGAAFRSGNVELGAELRDQAVAHAESVNLSSTYSIGQVLLAEHFMIADEPPPRSVMPGEGDLILRHPLGRAVVAVGWARLGEFEKSGQMLNSSLRHLDEESSFLLHLCVASEAAVLLKADNYVDQLSDLLDPWSDLIAIDGNAWWPDRPVAAALAELSRAKGEAAVAIEYATKARALAEATDDVRTLRKMTALIDAIERSNQMHSEIPGPLGELSERQQKIMLLIADGMTNLEISREIAYSVSTVKADVAQILNLLNITSRAQIARFAAEHPLFTRVGD